MSGATALVTGASGFIGGRLLEQLLASGHEVIAVTRDPGRRFPSGVQVRVADLASGSGVSADLFDRVTLVFHCAGELKEPPRMRQLHVEGTRRLLECAASHAGRGGRPIHWVQLSSVGAYGPPVPANRIRCVDEQTAEHPAGAYELTKVASDRLVVEAASDRISFSILRPANVIGRLMPNPSVRRVISMVRHGWFFHVGPEDTVANYVHVDDVASALLSCAMHPASHGQIFNLSNDCPWRDLIRHIAATLGVRARRMRIPEKPVRVIATVLGARLGNPLTHPRIDALVNRTRYPATKIERVLGFRHARPMPQSIDDLIGWSV